jgi:hypothetical protein
MMQPALEALGGKVKNAKFTIFTTTRENTAFALVYRVFKSPVWLARMTGARTVGSCLGPKVDA